MVRCEAVRWIDDDPQPGLVEVALTDADEKIWRLVDKSSVFDATGILRPQAHYPIPVLVACNVLERRTDRGGCATVLIDLLPWGVTDQVYEVPADRLTTGRR